MNKIYVEKKQFVNKNGEVIEYENFYVYAKNEYGIENMKVYVDIDKVVVNLLYSVGAIYNEEK